MIESSSSSGDSDTNNKFETISLMESPNPMLRLVIFGKLKKMIMNYKDQRLNEIDRRLLRGLFVKHLRDFDEEMKERNKKKSLVERLGEINGRENSDSSFVGT